LRVITQRYTFVLNLQTVLTMESLFDKISVRGLSADLTSEIESKRPGVSRNTVNLALKDERPAEERTPLRNYIREVAAKMIKEKPAFLKKCREIYPKYFPTHSDLDVPEEYQKFMHDTYISNEMAVIREFCSEHIELGESFSVPRLQVSSLLKNEFRNKSVRVPKDVDDMFQKYVRHLSKYIQGPVLVPKGTGDTIGFKGFKLKDPPNEFTKGKK